MNLRRSFLWIALAPSLGPIGCSSVKPPLPKPAAVLQAERLADEAARLTERQHWAAAATAWQQAADQYSLLNDPEREAIALHNLAQTKRELGQRSEAETHLGQAAHLNERSGNTNEWWRNQIALLQLEAQSGQSNHFEARLASLQRQSLGLGDPALRGLFLNELGLWQQRIGQWDQARSSLSEARALLRRAQQPSASAVALANLARVDERTGAWDEAARLWREALTEFEKLGQASGIARALAGLGRSLTGAKKDLSLAEDSLRRAARNFATLRQPEPQYEALLSLADCLRAQGKQHAAEAVREEAAKLAPGPAPAR